MKSLSEIDVNDLGEGNHYVYIRQDGYGVAHGGSVYVVSLWRLVLGRPLGEAVFEKISTVAGNGPEDAMRLARDEISSWGSIEISVTDDELFAISGSTLGRVMYDG